MSDSMSSNFSGEVPVIFASVSFWPLLIMELVARVVPARLIIR